MKRSLFLSTLSILAVSALFSVPAFGDKLAGPVEFKIMAGASLARSTGPLEGFWAEDMPVPGGFGLGAMAGAGAELPLTKLISFEIDVLFLQKTCRIDLRSLDGTITGHFLERLNEISAPLFYKFCLRRGTSPFLLAGGEVAFVLSRDARHFDYGLICGLGVRKKIRRGFFSIEGRYHHGLQDTRIGSPRLRKMRTFVLLAGFSF